MRDKVKTIMEGGVPDDAYYDKFLNLPDIIDRTNMHAACFGRGANHTEHEFYLASEIRASAVSFQGQQQRSKRTRLQENKVLEGLDEAESVTPGDAAPSRKRGVDVSDASGDSDEDDDDMDAADGDRRRFQQGEEDDSDIEIEGAADDALDGDTVNEDGARAGRSKKRPRTGRATVENGLEDGQAEQEMDDEESEADVRYCGDADLDEELIDASADENSVGFEDEEAMDDY